MSSSHSPSRAAEIAEIASQVRDRNYRIEVAEDGIHVYNAKSHHVAADALSLYPKLGVESDGGACLLSRRRS